jgi:ABC-type microcin C transport system duplicated ATPase subunit YejF
MPNNEHSVVSLHKERLRREQRLQFNREKVARGVDKVKKSEFQDPIFSIYPRMLTAGASIAASITIDEARSVRDSWKEALSAAMSGEIEISDADVARWHEHLSFAEQFVTLLYLCNGKDLDGDDPPSAYLGVMNP